MIKKLVRSGTVPALSAAIPRSHKPRDICSVETLPKLAEVAPLELESVCGRGCTTCRACTYAN